MKVCPFVEKKSGQARSGKVRPGQTRSDQTKSRLLASEEKRKNIVTIIKGTMIQTRRKDETGATEKAQVGAKTRALYEQCTR